MQSVVAVFFAIVALLATTGVSQGPFEPSCNCSQIKCGQPTISGGDCIALGGIWVHSYCHCCDLCEKIVGEGESCAVTLGNFPYPKCEKGYECVNNYCRKAGTE